MYSYKGSKQLETVSSIIFEQTYKKNSMQKS